MKSAFHYLPHILLFAMIVAGGIITSHIDVKIKNAASCTKGAAQ